MVLYRLAIHLLVFSAYFLVRRLQQTHSDELATWLEDNGALPLHGVLVQHGIWSKELLASTAMQTLPSWLLQDKDFLATYRAIKDLAAREVMLPLWLADQNLAHFLVLPDLHRLGYKYPGQIFEVIYEDVQLEQAERHLLRTDVHRFKNAVRQFMDAAHKNVAVLSHKESYTRQLSRWGWHWRPAALKEHLTTNPLDTPLMVLYALVSHAALTQALPRQLPGHTSCLYSLCLVWLAPGAGRLHVALLLAARVLVDPVTTALRAPMLWLWLGAVEECVSLEQLLLFSVLPTALFYLAVYLLSFQPRVTHTPAQDLPQASAHKQHPVENQTSAQNNASAHREDPVEKQTSAQNQTFQQNNSSAHKQDPVENQTSAHNQASPSAHREDPSQNKIPVHNQVENRSPAHNQASAGNQDAASTQIAPPTQICTPSHAKTGVDVAITGIGCLDTQLLRFVSRRSVSRVRRLLLQLHVVQPFCWEEVRRLKLDEVDVHWPACRAAITPAMAANNLHTLAIINNRAFTDADAEQLADLIRTNHSLEQLKVAYDYAYGWLEQLYHLLLWDAVPQPFSSRGAQLLLAAVQQNEYSPMKVLDLYGVWLQPAFLEAARTLKADRPQLTIMGSKPHQFTASLSSRLAGRLAVRLFCMLAVASFSTYSLWQVFTDSPSPASLPFQDLL